MDVRPHATASLREEHRLIIRVVDALDAMIDGARSGGALPLDDIAACTTFFRLFTDACHHGKEEDLLFAALEGYGLPAEEGPLGVMRAEHRLGRALVANMTDALARLRSGDDAARRTLLHAAVQYIELIRGHIAREDDGLFDLADQVVDGEVCIRLCEAYQHVCQRRFEGRTRPELEQIAAALVERYPRPPAARST